MGRPQAGRPMTPQQERKFWTDFEASHKGA